MTPADYDRLLTVIRALLDRQTRVIAAIDGRCGAEKLQMFRDRWIPLEESYFTAFDLPARCDMALKG